MKSLPRVEFNMETISPLRKRTRRADSCIPISLYSRSFKPSRAIRRLQDTNTAYPCMGIIDPQVSGHDAGLCGGFVSRYLRIWPALRCAVKSHASWWLEVDGIPKEAVADG